MNLNKWDSFNLLSTLIVNYNTVHRGDSENSDRLINDHGYTKVISEGDTSTPAMGNVESNTQEREVNNDEVSTIAETTEVHIPGDVVQVIITMRDDYLANLSSYRVWYTTFSNIGSSHAVSWQCIDKEREKLCIAVSMFELHFA